jgi:enediyne biosynthesis protein E4
MNTLFTDLPSTQTNIHFTNQINDNDKLNVINYEYLYNGGGVGVGDFNNDSLPDIYFTGNLVSNKLYLNRGNMKFEDVTELAAVTGNGKWSKGVSVIDINNDGLKDIYVSVGVTKLGILRANLLYVCQRIDPVLKIPLYKEMAKAYGLADTSDTQMANFFDYDNDGDLDVYLLVNELNENYPNEFRPIKKDGTAANTDKLLRNDFNVTLQHPFFTDVSKQAGITYEGYGLGVNVCDINKDGWKDIYVSNDYLSNNLLYINNKNGTFIEECSTYFKHTSRNAMGNDIADINNDGLVDVMELDMAPADNHRLKMMNNTINYSTFQNSEKFGYMHQYVRNVLQVNRGPRVLSNDSIGVPTFSEVAYFSGVAQTDWSWAPLLIDVDNDGWRDIMISNGLPKDMTDMDFMAYRDEAKNKTPIMDVLRQLPSVKIPNYIFQNNHDLTFKNKTFDWGWSTPSFSAGMAYADFDRDGDIDVVVNNTNMEAILLENNLRQQKDSSNYLQIELKGDSLNSAGIGTTITLYCKNHQQIYDCTPYRGYLSSVDNMAHFGLGNLSIVDSVVVCWPNFKKQTLKNLPSNQHLVVDIKNANTIVDNRNSQKLSNNLFTEVATQNGINFTATETDFIDFTIQRLIPHKLSQYGPSLAASDINGDGLDDIVVGGNSPNTATLYLQQADGNFAKQNFIKTTKSKLADDAGICLFDADGDNDNDIFIASGGAENSPGSFAYVDQFYRNDGKGNFVADSTSIPKNVASKSCVKATDYDNDGDLDLFIGGRVLPGSYPLSVSSFIYNNDGKGNFTDITNAVAPELKNIGMVCDAVWSDVDNDNDADLLLVGEWMPITILKNTNGKFLVTTNQLSNLNGWFNSITNADLDNDGDMDYVLGNYGENSFYQASVNYPLNIYAKDFDKNESFDAVMSTWLPSANNLIKKEYPSTSRDELIKEMTFMKGRFAKYDGYANTEMKDLFTKEELVGSVNKKVNLTKTGWVENKGKFEMEWHDLPSPTQWSSIFGIVINDFNGDGFMDISMVGNDYSMAPYLGRNDALNGLVLSGDGKGDFMPLSILQSGFYVPNDGKALVQCVVNNKLQLLASQNQDQLKVFQSKQQNDTIIKAMPNELYAMLTLKNGQRRKVEFGYGSSFLSQSSRFIVVNRNIALVEMVDAKKQQRIFKF